MTMLVVSEKSQVATRAICLPVIEDAPPVARVLLTWLKAAVAASLAPAARSGARIFWRESGSDRRAS